jgi:hypothetical protein
MDEYASEYVDATMEVGSVGSEMIRREVVDGEVFISLSDTRQVMALFAEEVIMGAIKARVTGDAKAEESFLSMAAVLTPVNSIFMALSDKAELDAL